ncbi:hypothetical protein JD844_032261 [Phrynosoma platyrhinos]|uniref:O-methyltransferase dimerisation domain-containing protein n=1 Tax=Phrynosoma platyrhinos TaxID=52577 RepID=A0ABQ7T4E2_PHRPL|nr:hypothetical protein JD844_032261 [Phrynosoma platyrhinos]
MDSEDEMLKILFKQQHGFLITKIMFTACELGVFDLLLESGDTLTSAAIAERLGTSRVGMERLLEACVGLKLLRMERKNNEGNHIRRRKQPGVSFGGTTLNCVFEIIPDLEPKPAT